MKNKMDNYLRELWLDMQDDHPTNLLRFEGAVNLALEVGLITAEKHELWLRRIKTCPDPTHIGGRNWCAYCGDIKLVEGGSHD